MLEYELDIIDKELGELSVYFYTHSKEDSPPVYYGWQEGKWEHAVRALKDTQDKLRVVGHEIDWIEERQQNMGSQR